VSRRLDRVVSSVAAQLMDATASTAAEVSQQVLADLVEQFDADAGFLRHNDHNVRASKLVAEWPPRPDRQDPDPLAVVHFTSADPSGLGAVSRRSQCHVVRLVRSSPPPPPLAY
jgi:hypothetical protein